MWPSEKFEAMAAGQKGSQAMFIQRRERFWPTTQALGLAAGRNRAGNLGRLYEHKIIRERMLFLYDLHNVII
jgi:hypothetical protein